MPPRLNKRQQREQEELATLRYSAETEQNEDTNVLSSSEGEILPAKSSGFAALMADGGEDETTKTFGESQSEEEHAKKGSKKKPKKKKKKPIVVNHEPSESISSPVVSSETKEQKRAAKKARQKEQAKANKEAKKDEIEKALEELSIRVGSRQTAAMSTSSTSQLISLLTVSANTLSPEAELRKFFGSRVVGSAPISSSKHKPSTHRGILLNAAVKGKSKNSLTVPKENWAHPRFREGLNAEELDEGEVPFYAYEQLSGGEKWYTLVSSSVYKSWTRSFVETVHRGDPTPFYHILQTFPYHADTLMQMAEIAAHREEHSSVSSLLERALYTYERALQVGGANVLTGRVRLDFDAAEARGLWLCIGRYIVDLLRRGCPWSAHNFTIILLALDPYIDPYGSLFMLDYTSNKAGKAGAEWFENMYTLGSTASAKSTDKETDTSRWVWDCLPGWIYARALAARTLEGGETAAEDSKSRAYLREAFETYPELIPLIAAKADISLPAKWSASKVLRVVVDYSDADDHGRAMLHALAHLYAARSSPLWRIPSNAEFFTSVLSSTRVLESEPPRSGKRRTFLILLSTPHSPLCYSIYRHILLSSQSLPSNQAQHYKRILKYFPKDIQAAIGRSFSFDPLPPATASSQYDESYWRGVDSGLNVLGRRQAPNGEEARGALQQLQHFLQAHPEMANRFPGGRNMPQQLLDMLNNGEDIGALWEGILAELAVRGGFGGGDEEAPEREREGEVDDTPNRMPGGMGDVEEPEQEFDDEEGGEEEEEEEEVLQQPQPSFLQSLFGRFFSFGGGGTQAPSDYREGGGEPAPDP